jgi:hypothetical protein
MSSYVKYATETSDTYFAGLTEAQESFLKSVTAFTSFLPAAPAQGSVEIPTMQEIMEGGFLFAQKFLKQQQEFFEKAIAASTPPGSANVSSRSGPPNRKSTPAS